MLETEKTTQNTASSAPETAGGPPPVEPEKTGGKTDKFVALCPDCGWKKAGFKSAHAAECGLKYHKSGGHCSKEDNYRGKKRRGRKPGGKDLPDNVITSFPGMRESRNKKPAAEELGPSLAVQSMIEALNVAGIAGEQNHARIVSFWTRGDMDDPKNTYATLAKLGVPKTKRLLVVEWLHGENAVELVKENGHKKGDGVPSDEELIKDVQRARAAYHLKLYGQLVNNGQGPKEEKRSLRHIAGVGPVPMTDAEYAQYMISVKASQGDGAGGRFAEQLARAEKDLIEHKMAAMEDRVMKELRRLDKGDDFDYYKMLKQKAKQAGMDRSTAEDKQFQVQMKTLDTSLKVIEGRVEKLTSRVDVLADAVREPLKAIGAAMSKKILRDESGGPPKYEPYSDSEVKTVGERVEAMEPTPQPKPKKVFKVTPVEGNDGERED